jgi:SEC-C motif-containing protein
MKPCPCHSGKSYENCCRPYHDGQLAENALVLMRSRYSAYALNLPAYIIATTHPENVFYTKDTAAWEKSIEEFSTTTQFKGLEILEIDLGQAESWVTFFASLWEGLENVSFEEKSHFVKIGGKWLYKSGVVKKGTKNF